jgi:glyoxylase-like metal-dependent hydrolase (beta-lactamase superfamily II)
MTSYCARLVLPVLAMAGAALPVSAQPAASVGPLEGREVAPGIHLFGTPADYSGPAIGNMTVIEQSDGLVLVDSGATIGHGRALVAYIRSISDKPVKAVMITHWHNDHPLGVAAIREVWPMVRVISTPATKAGLLGPARTSVGLKWDDNFETQILNDISASIGQVAALKTSEDPAIRARYTRYVANMEAFARAFRGTYLVPPTETFARELVIDDRERPVRMMFLGRANTAGDAIAWLPRQRVVVTGDIVVSPIPFGFFSYPESWIAVLQRLKELDFALLIPGHGEPQKDQAYLDKLIATIADIRDQIGRLAKQGVPLEGLASRVDFSKQKAIFGTSSRLAAAFESLWLTPMSENAWKEARGLEIVQGEGEATPRTVRRKRS